MRTLINLSCLMALGCLAQTAHAQAAPAPAAASAAQGAALKGLLLLSQDLAAPPAAAPAPARELCLPAAQALAAPPDAAAVAALRAQLAALPADAAPAQRIASALPAQLLPEAALRERLAPYLGRSVNTALTSAITTDVAALLRQEGRYLADVYFPEQTASAGVLTLVVRPAVLGTVTAKGQQHHEAQDIACRIRLQAGQAVDLQVLAQDLAALNAGSGWRYTAEPEFTPGKQPGSTDLTLNTRDEKPLRFFVGADNTGGRATGQGRYRAGVNIGNFLGRLDHQFDYTLTSASSYKRLNQHSLAYQMPLQERQRLTARLDLSKSDVSLEDGLFQAKGSNRIASVEWSRPSDGPAGSGRAGETSFGLEYKRVGNSLAFNQVVLSERTPEVLQAWGAWRSAWQGSFAALGSADKPAPASSQLYARLTLSPGGLLGNNDNDTFDAVRPGAKAGYWRVNAAYNGQLGLPGQWSLGLNVNAQAANQALISSERMTLSGWGGVRGYYSDTLSADAGVTGSLELLSPRQRLDIAGQSGVWYGVAFLDAGRSWNANAEYNADLNKTASQFSLVSHGLGLRFETSKHSHLRLDVARRHFGLDNERKWLWHGSWQAAF
jgi:hemolysin activation/secretion protein